MTQTHPRADESATGRHHLVLALVSGAAMLLEITLTRLISVALWYPFAYIALSTAMLGFGGAAVAVTLSPTIRRAPLDKILLFSTIAFAAAALGGYPLWNALPVAPMSLGSDPAQAIWGIGLLLLVALPFGAAGIFVARIFAAFPSQAPRLYAADLLGAAAGVVAYVILIPIVGGPGLLGVVAVLGIVAALLIAPDTLHLRAGLALTCVALVALIPQIERIAPLRITPNKLLGSKAAEGHKRAISWNLSSAIDVIPNRTGALIIIDGGTAMTLAPRLRKRPGQITTRTHPRGLRAVPYALHPAGTTLIIGSGGGVEVDAALGAKAPRVVAVEIDGAINDLVRGKLSGTLGGMFADSRVELHTAEARSFLAALPEDERFDVIVGFHTISNAANSTGAMSLAENYLMTVEAMALLLGRLSDDGVLLVSRPEQQVGRLAATAALAWQQLGRSEDLRAHTLVTTHDQQTPGFVTGLVISRTPIDAAAINRVRNVHGGRIVYAPDGSGDQQAWIEASLQWQDPGSRASARALAKSLPFTTITPTPATDDQPFFNLQKSWSDLRLADITAVFRMGASGRARLEDASIAQVAIVILLAQVLLLAALFVVPAAISLKRSGVAAQKATRIATTFAALGLAFMLLEVVLIQTVTRIVGEPAWSMVAVLAVLLASSGAGSLLLAGRLRWAPGKACLGAVAAAMLVAHLTPLFADLAASLPFAARLGVAVLLVAPPGLLMGAPFSSTMRLLDRDDLVAWAWALNSLLSVGGSIGALILGSALGFSITATVAAGMYGVAWFASRHIEADRIGDKRHA